MYSINRNIENVVKQRGANSKAILLMCPRQVGKSTLLRHLYKGINAVTFDDDLLLAQASEDPQMFLYNNPCPLIIDEVQKCPSIFNRIKIYLDKTEEYSNFYLTGSQKLQLMEGISESLAGRISIIELDGEIDLIISENGVLYPIEIKMSANPKADMASEFDILDKVKDAQRGMGVIVCMYDKKMYLGDNLVVLPINYI